GQAAITVVLDRLDLAEADADTQPDVDTNADIDLAGTLRAAAPQHVLGDFRDSIKFKLAVVAIGDCLVHALSSRSVECRSSKPEAAPTCRKPMSPDETDDAFDGPSRSQLRRDATAIFKLAETLAVLTDAQLTRIPL